MKAAIKKDMAALLLILSALALGPVLIVGSYVYQKHQWANQRLSEFEPRYARLAGLDSNREALQQASDSASAMEGWYLHAAARDSNQTGNDAQQRVRNILSSAGMVIASSQVLPAKEEQGIERIPLTGRAEGDLVALQSALIGLAEQKPALLVDGMTVQVVMVTKGQPPRLSVVFNLLILRKIPS